jgi:pyruvate/2-oxoglutarate dehydrogenase complex dihydrolipoamide acyltransferase (E2) component
MHTTGLFCIGKVEKRPICDEQGNIITADMSSLVATGDHRVGDAVCFSPLFKCFRGYVEDPERFDPEDLHKYPENPHYSEKATEYTKLK